MKKVLLSALLIIIFIFYSIHQRNEQQDAQRLVTLPTIPVPPSATPPSTPTPTSSQVTLPITTSAPPATPTPTPTTVAKGQYKDGSYTGDSVDVFYGNVQVKAIISGGKLADIQFLDFPNDRQTSRMISSAALPVLRNEAIQNQNATIDIVTGATQTSDGFAQSLKSALDQAK